MLNGCGSWKQRTASSSCCWGRRSWTTCWSTRSCPGFRLSQRRWTASRGSASHVESFPGGCTGGLGGKTRHYFARKLPIAVERDKTVFIYVDPGHSTDKGVRSWGAAHRGLWEALQKRGQSVQVAVVAREDRALERAEVLLRNWNRRSLAVASATDPWAAREYAEIKRAVLTGDTGLLDSYGGVTAALKRAIELEPLAQDRSFRVVIDGYSTWQSPRLWRGRF